MLLSTLLFFGAMASAQAQVEVRMLYLERQVERPATLSNLDPIPEDEGFRGAELGVAENATTGRFLGQNYDLEALVVAPDEPFLEAARAALAETPLAVVNAPMADLLALADSPEAEGALIFNAGAPEIALRDGDCRANVLHTLPSRAMLADALAQALATRRWRRWLLIEGPREADQALADAFAAAAEKFGARLVERKQWSFDADMRRNAWQEAPAFTQAGDYDVVVVADEANDFARYIPYNTWLPRPVAGSEGLRPAAWAPVVEQWGAVQLQNRFEELSGRSMRPVDYAAWAAVRAIGEAVTRTKAADPATVRDYLLSDAFALGGFKGRPLSFRGWNGQLRQPIPLVHSGAVVVTAPLEGFLHRRDEMDSMGLDEPETACAAFDE